MKKKTRLFRSDGEIYLCIQKERFRSGDTPLMVEDWIHLLHPWKSERILRIPGTSMFYSSVPLSPLTHRLRCYPYCADALETRSPRFYRHALVLGCGGGAIPRWLLQTYRDVSVDVVDWSPEILSVCRKYFLKHWEHSGRLQFHCIDARNFVPPVDAYQFLFCDLFDGSEVAPFVCDPHFAQKLRAMLGEKGVLVINCGFMDPQKVKAVYQDLFPYLQIVERKTWQTKVIRASDSPFPSAAPSKKRTP